MEDGLVNFEFQVFVKEVYYYTSKDCSSVSVGVRLLDFPPVIIQSTNHTINKRDLSVHQPRGKSCKFVMPTSTLVTLLQNSPNCIEVCLMKSHDISHDCILAVGKINDSKVWCKELTKIKKRELVINKSYLVHVSEFENKERTTDPTGHVIIKVKLCQCNSNDTTSSIKDNHYDDILVKETGQTVKHLPNQPTTLTDPEYLPNTWIPPPLHYTATHSITSSNSCTEEDEELPAFTDNKTKLLTEKNWTALMNANINNWPWTGYEHRPLDQVPFHTNKPSSITTSTHSVQSTKSIDDKPCITINGCPLLTALCNEIKTLQITKNHDERVTTVDKSVQTDDDVLRKRHRRKKSSNRTYKDTATKIDQEMRKGQSPLLKTTSVQSDELSSVSSSSLNTSSFQTPSHPSLSHPSPSHLSPSHLSPSHLSPSHMSPSHLSPSHLSPSHMSPSHISTIDKCNSPSHKPLQSPPTPIIIQSPSSSSSSSFSSTRSDKLKTNTLTNAAKDGRTLSALKGQKIYLVSSLQSLEHINEGEQNEKENIKKQNERDNEGEGGQIKGQTSTQESSQNVDILEIQRNQSEIESTSEIEEELYSSDFESDIDD